jgi:type I restriction enzyme S subunit
MKTKTKFKQTEIGMIPEDWDIKEVSDFCSRVTSGGTPSRTNEGYWKNGTVLWLKTQELNDGNIYDADEKISENGLKNSSAKLFPKETVLIAMYGATVGKLGILKIEAATNQAFCAMIVDQKKSNNRYLFYSLLNRRNKLVNLASGAAQQNLNQDMIKRFKLPFPSLPEQKDIAKILSDLDSKIELNQQMNKTLEAIGQAIFKHWFIDFEFPNEERKPYRSSGGEMIYNEELGKEIPKYWEVKKIDDIAKSISQTHVFDKERLIFLNTSDIHEGQILNHSYSEIKYFPGQAKKSIKKDDILFSEIRPINHRFAYVNIDANDYVVSTKLMVIRTNKQILSKFLYNFLVRDDVVSYLQHMAESRSGTFPQITFDEIASIKITIPVSETLFQSYENLMSKVFSKIWNNRSTANNLIKIRDSLLPKLMSGKIRVPVEAN